MGTGMRHRIRGVLAETDNGGMCIARPPNETLSLEAVANMKGADLIGCERLAKVREPHLEFFHRQLLAVIFIPVEAAEERSRVKNE